MKTNNCTLLIASCDNYSDLWDPFFELLNRFWKDLQYDIVLSTESSNYVGKYHKINNIHPSLPSVSWSKRIYDSLDKIENDYVILMLDDFFLKGKVDNERVTKTLNWLKANKNIATFTYWPISFDGIETNFEGFEERPKVAKYKVSAILGIWNKKTLMKYLCDYDENAWQWEINATERANTKYKNDKFYITINNDDQIFPYDFTSEGLFAGKWFKNTVPLFKRLKIDIDFEKRGFYNETLRGLSSSILYSFEFDSALIPYYEFKNKRKVYHKNNSKIKSGIFFQKYEIKDAESILRWEPATQWGFSVKKLVIEIEYKDKGIEIIDNNTLFGSFLKKNEVLYFNKTAPNVYIPTKYKRKMKKITIYGELVFPLSEEELIASYNIETEPQNEKDYKLFNSMYHQFLLIPEKTNYIRINSEWTILSTRGVVKKVKSQKSIKGGLFNDCIEIPPNSNSLTWLPSKTCGYAIKNLKIYYSNNKKFIKIDEKLMKNLPLKFNSYYLFLDNRKIEISIPDKNADKILIKGKMVRPISAKMLRKAIFPKKEIIKK